MVLAVEPALPQAVQSVVEALLIGFLIGAQREASHGEGHPGVRDFVLIGLTGAICGLLQNAWLTVAALLSITAMLAVFYFHMRERTGITTEMAAVATFTLGFLVATPGNPLGAPLAVGTAVVVVAFLEAKRSLHRLVRETITEIEFNDTLRFLALIFIIYPVLPTGSFGPYGFFDPRKIWTFVILVGSISYLGYFLEKFLGSSRGLRLTGLLGGIASTTAATASFARACRDRPEQVALYAQAAVLANAVQFPRLLVILAVFAAPLAAMMVGPMALMSLAGLAVSAALAPRKTLAPAVGGLSLSNPLQLWPALKFGLVFALILFFTKAAAAVWGGGGVYWTGALGGALDTDAVAVSAAELLTAGRLTPDGAWITVLLALASNAVVKTVIAFATGGRDFGLQVTAGFAAMFAAAVLGWWAVP
ncbi:MAG: MgtC/SapB family protein [Bryobacterales bacterium]|nr:DUF4010 domain-containing protein [Bryobacteraceae bacterium]MDW8354907.1 MgtC/SapB family protein [Bryobacterales bacterium]